MKPLALPTCPICGSLRQRPRQYLCGTEVPSNPDTPAAPSEKCRALAFYHFRAVQGRAWNASVPEPTEGHGDFVTFNLLLHQDHRSLGFRSCPARVYPDTGLIAVDFVNEGAECPEECCKAIQDKRYLLPPIGDRDLLHRVVNILNSVF